MSPQSFLASPLRFLLLALLFGAASSHADEASESAQRVYDRPNRQDFTTVGRMMLTEKRQAPPRIRELAAYRLDHSGGEPANLIGFLDPEDIAGTGLFSIDKADGSSDQWLYLPALDRARRISSDPRAGASSAPSCISRTCRSASRRGTASGCSASD